MTSTPLAQATILAPPDVPLGDALGMTYHQRAEAPGHGPLDDRFGSLVVGLAHTTAMAGLGRALGGGQLAPPPGAPLAAPRHPTAHLAGPALGVGQVQTLLGPDGPARDEQGLVRSHRRVGMDDAQIHPSHPGGVGAVVLDRDLGSDVEDEASGVDE